MLRPIKNADGNIEVVRIENDITWIAGVMDHVEAIEFKNELDHLISEE